MSYSIPFNKPYLTGKETHYITDAISRGKISGNGDYTKKCQNFFEEGYGFGKSLLTTSCTDALEMSAILLDIKEGDEVIMPSYTFVSTANAFVLRGANVRFIDSRKDHPGVDERLIEGAISDQTKAIVVVHYAGVACDMEYVMALGRKYGIPVVEDAAQAIDSFFTFSDGTRKALGSIGDLATFSFHETKNIISGEGGMLVVNNEKYVSRAEIIWEKGTNRASFFRGEVDKYSWVDIGSSFLPSEVVSAFLYAQLENLEGIQSKRVSIWNFYMNELSEWARQNNVELPKIPLSSTNNAHMFYLVMDSLESRTKFISKMKEKGILTVFHYLGLHESVFYRSKYTGDSLPNCDRYTNRLVRLPLFFELSEEDLWHIVKGIKSIELS